MNAPQMPQPRSPRACALAAALSVGLGLGLGLAPPVLAQDYSPDAETWNGLGYLFVTADEAKVALEPVDTLDLGKLRPGDIVMWVYPAREPPLQQLLAFVRDGGYLIVADDHGAAGPLLAALGITRVPLAPVPTRPLYQGLDGLPVLTPERDHFLFFNVESLTANHPVGLTGEGEPILGLGPGSAQSLIVERRVGEGAVLVIGDPSLFLNEMLRRFYGNKQFAANCMRLYCERDLCPLTLLRPHAQITGRYRAGLGRLGRLPAFVDTTVTALDDALGELDVALGRPPWNTLLVAVALALIAGLFLVVARRPVRRLSEAPPLRNSGPSHSPVHQETVGLVQGQNEADFADRARVLVREVERLRQTPAVARALEEPLRDTSPEADDTRVVARNALLRIQHEADSFDEPAPTVVSAERFLRLLSDVRTVCRYLDQRALAKSRSPRSSLAPAQRPTRR